MKTKKHFRLTAILVGLTLLIACNQNEKTTCTNPACFEISRGVNLSHWLSQDFGWAPKYSFVTENDIRFIDSIGYDHVRIPIDEIEMWDGEGQPIAEAFTQLHNCIGWCDKYGLSSIVDLHTIRAHHFNAENEGGKNTLWDNDTEQEKFVGLWLELSEELKKYPVNKVAYEILNEAVAPEHDQWNKLLNKTISALREHEPERVLVVGPNMWQIAPNLQYLKLPEGDKNIILSFHTYSPMMLTHYTAGWTQLRNYSGEVTYPGPIISEEDYAANVDSTNQGTFQFYQQALESWGSERLTEVFQSGLDFAREKGLQLYCGEFGCMPTVSREARLKFYADQVNVFEENGIAWCNWEYKGDFGIYYWDYDQLKPLGPDWDFIHTLLPITGEK